MVPGADLFRAGYLFPFHMSVIHVIRHGQTDFNLEGRYQGRIDVPLSDTGRAQAASVAEKITGLSPEIIFCSPLERVLKTAEIIAGRFDIDTGVEPRLIERALGVYEGLTKTEAAARFPELYARNITRSFDCAPTGGETPREVCSRVTDALNDILQRADGRPALIVTHGFVAKAIDAYFNPNKNESEFFAFSLKNGEVVSYSPTP